jgi:hypothetical protein
MTFLILCLYSIITFSLIIGKIIFTVKRSKSWHNHQSILLLTEAKLLYQSNSSFFLSLCNGLLIFLFGLQLIFIIVELSNSPQSKMELLLPFVVAGIACSGIGLDYCAQSERSKVIIFDKDTQKLTVKKRKTFKSKIVEYSLWEIADIIFEETTISDGGSSIYSILVVLKNTKKIILDKFNCIGNMTEVHTNAKKDVKQIKAFLDIS